MLNTWGLFSINKNTFQSDLLKGKVLTKELRQHYYTLLKINNLVFNPLGYFPREFSFFSGVTRMGLSYYAFFSPYWVKGYILKSFVEPWTTEIRSTCIAQFTRGFLEAFLPFGKLINLGLDIAATYQNIPLSDLG